MDIEQEKKYYELQSKLESQLNKLRQDFQEEINLLIDRIIVIEKLSELKMFPKKICNNCSASGKIFCGTIFNLSVQSCHICNGTGFI